MRAMDIAIAPQPIRSRRIDAGSERGLKRYYSISSCCQNQNVVVDADSSGDSGFVQVFIEKTERAFLHCSEQQWHIHPFSHCSFSTSVKSDTPGRTLPRIGNGKRSEARQLLPAGFFAAFFPSAPQGAR